MMNKKSFATTLFLGATVLSLGVSGKVYADESNSTIETTSASLSKDEGWNIPSVALGNGLTESEQKDTLKALKVKDNEKYNTFFVDGDDLVKYVTDIDSFTSQSKAYSSAYIVRTDEGSGVNVSIETPENITARTESAYRNAAITSGVSDADIRIASVRVMDGSGALAGIYKVYDEIEPAETEEEANERAENREVAQDEMAVTSDITESNSDNKDFSDENLAVAMADIKLELQEIKDKLKDMDEDKAKEEVQGVVEKQLKEQGLEDVVTPEQQEQITNLMLKFKDSSAIDNEELKSQLSSLKNDIMENGKDFINNAKEALNSEETKSFFGNLWEKISTFFSNLFGGNSDSESTESTN